MKENSPIWARLAEISSAVELGFPKRRTIAYAATGRPPFGSGEPATVSYRAVHEPIELAGVEPELAGLIQHCVAKDPAARPRLAEVIARCRVLAALVEDPFYAGLAGLAEALPSAASVAVSPPPAHPPATGLHDLPTSASTHAPGYTPTQVSHPAPPARRRPAPWIVAVTAGLVVGAVTAAFVLLPDRGKDDAGADGKETTGTARPGATSKAPTTPGGEQQQLEMAMALMGSPRVLLIDEPSLGLDPINVDVIFRQLDLLKQNRVTVVMVEQNAVRALEATDRAYVLEQGRTRMSGPSEAILKDPDVRELYLGGAGKGGTHEYRKG